jgi:hypothetical protein
MLDATCNTLGAVRCMPHANASSDMQHVARSTQPATRSALPYSKQTSSMAGNKQTHKHTTVRPGTAGARRACGRSRGHLALLPRGAPLVGLFARICVRLFARICVCLCVCSLACVCVWVCVRLLRSSVAALTGSAQPVEAQAAEVRAHTNTHTHACARARTATHTQTCAHARTHARAHTHTHKHARAQGRSDARYTPCRARAAQVLPVDVARGRRPRAEGAEDDRIKRYALPSASASALAAAVRRRAA